jgi:ligand-binding SRPBCC domain-containing protein
MIHRLIHETKINAPLEVVWEFFSTPENLAFLTPDKMNMRITSGKLPDHVYPGQIITYKVSPLFGFAMNWMTEITHVVPGKFFVDEQKRGPFKMWHHQHHFEAVDGGVMMKDIVHYEVPFWILGSIAHALIVKKDIEDIFEYRQGKIEERFGM